MVRQEETAETEEPERAPDPRVRPEYHDGVLRRVVVEPPEDLGTTDVPDEAGPEPVTGASDISVPTPSRAWATTTVDPGPDEPGEPVPELEPEPEPGSELEPEPESEITLPVPASSWGVTRVEPGERLRIPESAWPTAGEDDPAAVPAEEPEPEPPSDITLPRPSSTWGVTKVEPGHEVRVPEAAWPETEPDVTLPTPTSVHGVTRVGADEEAAAGLAATAPEADPVPEADFAVVDAAEKGGGDPEAGAAALADLARTAPPTRVPARRDASDADADGGGEPAEPEDAVGQAVEAGDGASEAAIPDGLEDGVEAAVAAGSSAGDDGPGEAVAARVDEVLAEAPHRGAPGPAEDGLGASVDELLAADPPATDDGDDLAGDVDELLEEQGLD